MEHVLTMLALLLIGPLVGFEFAVAAVFNPLAAGLPDGGFRLMRGAGSRWLGAAMPFWYVGTLLVVLGIAVSTGDAVTIGAVALMGVAVVLSVAVLVPINRRIGRWRSDADVDRGLARRWDVLHDVRVALLVGTLVLVILSS